MAFDKVQVKGWIVNDIEVKTAAKSGNKYLKTKIKTVGKDNLYLDVLIFKEEMIHIFDDFQKEDAVQIIGYCKYSPWQNRDGETKIGFSLFPQKVDAWEPNADEPVTDDIPF